MASEQVWNARDMGSIPTLGTIFPIFINPYDNTIRRDNFDWKYKIE